MLGPQLASRGRPTRKPTTSPSTSAAAPERTVDPKELLDLGTARRGILVLRVEPGLDEPLSAVPLGEEDRGVVEVLLGEGHDRG